MDQAEDFGDDEGEEIGEPGEEEAPSLAPGPREGQREAVQARALLEKAESSTERVPAEDKPEVERLMEKVARRRRIGSGTV